jgi:hypothetical protein
MGADFVLGVIVGAVLMYALPRGWKHATAADREETRRAPARRGRR